MKTRSMVKKRKLKEEESRRLQNLDFINNLPDDCLAHVFSFLPVEDKLRTTGVCKRWKDFGCEAWRNMRKLDLISLEKLQTEHTRTLTLCGRFLEDLSIPIPYKSNIIRIATSNCHKLRKIQIRFEYFGAGTDKGDHGDDLAQLFMGNQEVRSVTMENLRHDFSHCIHCLSELPGEILELQLCAFRIHGTGCCGHQTSLAPFDLVIRRFKKLQSLALDGFDIHDDELRIIEDFHDLRFLEIYGRGEYLNLDPVASPRKLEYLHVHSVKPKGDMNSWVVNLAKNVPGLKHLKLDACWLNQEGYEELKKLSALETLQLTSLYLKYYDYDFSNFHYLKKLVCDDVQDSAIIRLMEVASELEFVNLTAVVRISPRVIDKAHEVTSRRTNMVPLHIIIEGNIIANWKRPKEISPLLTVECARDYIKRTDCRYENVEL